eukprot:Gb_25834 [translate_table: standard]
MCDMASVWGQLRSLCTTYHREKWSRHGQSRPEDAMAWHCMATDDGLRVSFISTPYNISRIKRLIEPERGHIDLVELPLPSVEGLPHGTESTANIKNKMIPLLLNVVDMWKNPFETLLRQLCPHCIIHDFAQCCTPRLATKLGIPSIFFLTLGGASRSLFHVVSRGLDENIKAQNLTTLPLESYAHPAPKVDNSSIENGNALLPTMAK